MIIHAEVSDDGVVKVKDPALWGKSIFLAVPEEETRKPTGKTNWEEIWKLFKEADALDIPRRSHEEILHDLRSFRESE